MFLRFLAISVGFLSAFALRSILELWGPGTEFREQASRHDVVTYDDHQISRVLFIDSVLTIVGNYYVDPSKVGFPKLFISMFDGLMRQGWLTYTRDGESVTVESHGQVKQWSLRHDAEGEQLAYFLLEVAGFLSEVEKKSLISKDEVQPVEDLESLDRHVQHVLNTLLAELDPHSSVLSQDDYHDLKQGTEGVFGGLGVLVGVRQGQLTVIKPLPNSPASKANIRRLDRILAIDGVSTFGYELDDLVSHMRGLPGSQVKLRLLKEGGRAPEMVTMTREMIQVDAVTSRVVFSDKQTPALVLKVDSFSNHTVTQARSALFKFHQEFGRDKGVVVDLRGNPGGLLDQAVRLSDLFLGHGLVVSTRGRLVESEFSRSEFGEEDFPVAVLIDGESASASEIVAAALQDRKRAIVIGQTSFGKGSVQTIFELPEQRALKLTIARYYTPNDRSLQNHGVKPDILMQPVFADKHNKNLLGVGRYRQESFLQRFTMKGQKHPWENQESYYYLIGKDEVGEYAHRSFDHEMQFAVHWVEDKIEAHKSLEKWTQQSVEHLSSLGVKWSSKGCSARALELILDDSSQRQVAYASDLKIPFQVRNVTSKPCDQISIFLHADDHDLEPVEVLIGRLDAGEMQAGELVTWLPSWTDVGDLHYSVGLAVSGLRYGGYYHRSVEVIERELGEISHAVTFNDAHGGAVEGFLENNEEAVIEVVLTNRSRKTVKTLSSNLFNLAGGQIEVHLDSKSSDFYLSPGETKTLKHKIVAKNLARERLTLGVVVTSDDMMQPVMEEFTVRTLISHHQTAKSNSDHGSVH